MYPKNINEFIGKKVKIKTKTNEVVEGILEYVDKLDERGKKPGYYYCGVIGLKKTHISSINLQKNVDKTKER